MQCIYCQESDEYRVLIPKPIQFVWNGWTHKLIDNGKPVCLKCLDFEMNELKET